MCIVQFSDGITFTFNFVDNTWLMTLYVDRCILQPVQTCMLMLSTIVSTIYIIIHNIILYYRMMNFDLAVVMYGDTSFKHTLMKTRITRV